VHIPGVLYEIVLHLGHKLCPYYQRLLGRVGRWMAYGIPVAWMMDDWLTVGKTKEEAGDLMAPQGDHGLWGFKMEAEKPSEQKQVFLGILINSIDAAVIRARGAKGFFNKDAPLRAAPEAGRHWDDRTCKRIAGITRMV
jgi:hypothetical protein